MKTAILTLAVIFMLLIKTASATNIRGQLVRNYNGMFYALPGVRVDLMVWNGQSWVDVSYAVTGNDGFYFFINLSPGTIFCINVFGRFYPAQSPLQVANVALQDVPVIST